jgi:DNA-binding FrmR family transcriptional regulator
VAVVLDAALKRIEGQSRGLQRMVENEEYCIDILTQVSAMTKALQSVLSACSTST